MIHLMLFTGGGITICSDKEKIPVHKIFCIINSAKYVLHVITRVGTLIVATIYL